MRRAGESPLLGGCGRHHAAFPATWAAWPGKHGAWLWLQPWQGWGRVVAPKKRYSSMCVPMAWALPGIRAGSSVLRPRVWAPTATHKPLQTPPWAGLSLVRWGQFTEQITELGCEPAVSKSLCPSRGTGNSVSMGGSTDLGDEPLGRQEETSLLAQHPSFQHISCSRQGWRTGSSSQAEKFLCIQSFYSIKICGPSKTETWMR